MYHEGKPRYEALACNSVDMWLYSGNRSRIATVVCVPLSSNLKWALAPGNVHLRARHTGLPKDSVANVSLILSIDKGFLSERVGKLPLANLELVLAGIDTVLGK